MTYLLISVAHVKSPLGMELTLNLGWVLVALTMTYVWLRIARRAARERSAQFAALAIVILILLPAISMTDDLMAAQNPAEIDTCVRRDDTGSVHAHSGVPLLAALPSPEFSGLVFGVVQMPSPNHQSVPCVEIPSLASIENRPPPLA